MKHYAPDHIRNVGLFGHGSCGKTSLVEAMLYDAKAITRLGRVEDGNTVCDFDPDEVKRHISVNAAIAPVEWENGKINLIDAPGTSDFLGEMVSAMRVIDGAVILVDAAAGVEVGTERAWRLAEERGLPRILFVNKMDRENANFGRALESARNAFGKRVAPIEVPIGQEKDFRGVVSLLDEHAMIFGDHSGVVETIPIPEELKEEVAQYRQHLVEAIAEQDEDLMTRYLDDQPISTQELIEALDKCVEAGQVVPVLCGSATHNRGAQPLLDAITAYFPPASRVTARGLENGAEVTLVAQDSAPLAAIVFKTVADAHVGRVSYFRVYSGTFKSNSQVLNASNGKHERVGQLFYVRGKEHISTDAVHAGDIGAVGKLAATVTGESIADDAHPIVLPGIDFPAPSYAASVNPRTKADLDKMGQALQRLAEEDPTLHVGRDPVTGEAIISGLGEPHVQIAMERMTRRFGVNVDIGLPRVAYRETISTKTVAEYKHKKQTGGAGQYGHVFLEIAPNDGDFAFADRVVGGAVPKNFFPAVEKGVREALEAGPVAGYPVVNISVTLTDGSYHDVDSNEMAFKIAAKEAFKKGILQGQPILLEPLVNIRVTVPDGFTGDVMSDLNGKRAHVSGMNPEGNGTTTIEAEVPEAEVQRYATDLRSITQGRGSFTSTFSRYQQVPHNVAEQVKAAAAKRAESANSH